MTTSRYRLKARQRIAEILATLPPEAGPKAKRKALREASPYRDRRSGDGTSWPYKMWCKEVSLALGEPRRQRQGFVAPPSFRLSPPRPLTPGLWLSVRCGWCSGKMAGGCLLCSELRTLIERVVADPTFRALRDACRECPEDVCVLQDWLSEHGIDLEANHA